MRVPECDKKGLVSYIAKMQKNVCVQKMFADICVGTWKVYQLDTLLLRKQ